MSQSAASSALQDLERRYDTQLFDRVGKRLQLNSHGATLQPLAEALLSQAAEVENALLQRRVSGALTIGATLTIGNYLAISIVAQFKRDYPAIDLRLHVANTAQISREVLNFDLDIGLIEGEYAHPDLQVTPWRDDELVVFCAPSHPLAGRAVLSDSDLLAARWILREPGSGTRQTFDRAMQGLLVSLQVHLQLEHTEAIKRAVQAGMGIGCLSKIALTDAFARGDLLPLAVPQRDMRRMFYFVTHRDKHHTQNLRQWIAACRASG